MEISANFFGQNQIFENLNKVKNGIENRFVSAIAVETWYSSTPANNSSKHYYIASAVQLSSFQGVLTPYYIFKENEPFRRKP